MDTLHERITQRREALDLSLSELARRAHISKGHLSNIEAGKSDVNAGTLNVIARELGTTIDALMNGYTEPDDETGRIAQLWHQRDYQAILRLIADAIKQPGAAGKDAP